jgi:hypothetical protein
MNGIHHALFMLKRNAGGPGVHETQHIRSFMLDDTSAEQHGKTGAGTSRSGVPQGSTEPATCPYTVKDITTAAGQHSRTSTTSDDNLEESNGATPCLCMRSVVQRGRQPCLADRNLG